MQVQPVSDNNNQTFGTRIKNRQIKGIVGEIKEVSKPFLEEQKPQIDLIYKLRQKLDSAINSLWGYISVPKYNTAEFKEAKRLHLGELDHNLEEYNYLFEKSQKWFVTPEVAKYAEEIRQFFVVPKQLQEPYSAYKQLQMDIHNGLNGRNFPNKLKEKFEALREGRSKLSCLTGIYSDVKQERKNVNIYLSTGVRNPEHFKRSLANIKEAVEFHKEHLGEFKQRISQAGDLYEQNALTPDDYALISTNPQQRIISRCVSKFNKKVAGVNLSKEDNIAINEQLQKQKEAIETLWHKIEASKKETFATNNTKSVNYDYPDDMPF